MAWVLKILVAIILLFTYGGVIPLVQKQYRLGDSCPKIVGVPACYIILGCLILVTIGFVITEGRWQNIFYIGVIPALAIAVYATIGQLLGFAECPKTSSGIPMCYISFGIFSSLFILNSVIHRLAT